VIKTNTEQSRGHGSLIDITINRMNGGDLIRSAAERGTQQTSQQPFKSNREIRGVRKGLGCYLQMSRSCYKEAK
jgi:hypothetical protein